MTNVIKKEYNAFQTNGFKSWSDNTPMVEVVTADTSHWVSQHFTIEEAHQIIHLLNTAIVDAESAEDHVPWSLDDETPF
jgi:hypothetical protein